MTGEREPLLKMEGISKLFPGVVALSDVHLELGAGEILAIVGENGAGKSTLMKILGGVHQPDYGKIFLDGEEVVIRNVEAATTMGIAFVHQELNLADNLDIASNIFLGREYRKRGILRLLDKKSQYREAGRHLKRISIDSDPCTLVRDIGIGTQQMVEIAKALSIKARILIMDEPTSSLSSRETEKLFEVMKELKRSGVSILYISHRMGEVKEIADRVVVLRDGAVTGYLDKEEISRDRMIKLMVGRDIDSFYHVNDHITEEPVLEVRNFILPEHSGRALDVTVHKGEIVTLAGLVGAGRTEFLHALFGISRPLGGQILLNGKEITIEKPLDAIRHGIVLVPEDRKQNGLVLEMSVEENVTLANLFRMQRNRMIQFEKCREVSRSLIKSLNVKTTGVDQIVETLSGGNQQKIVLAKWLALHPKVLLLDEPTRGIDVVAKSEIYRLMEALAADGVAILVVSSEMHEVMGISDRIIVIHEGAIAGELMRGEFEEELIVGLATGG